MNHKIRNATKSHIKGITFKSTLEKTIYNTLLQEGFKPEYEPKTFTLWDGFTPLIPYYDKETDKQQEKRLIEFPNSSKSKILVLKNAKIIGIRYTPDFYFKYKDVNIYIEAKGFENDVFYIKKKMFVNYLGNLYKEKGIKSMYFEIYTRRQLLQALQIIKDYEEYTSRQNI